MFVAPLFGTKKRDFLKGSQFLAQKLSTIAWGLRPQTPAGGETPPDPPGDCVLEGQP